MEKRSFWSNIIIAIMFFGAGVISFVWPGLVLRSLIIYIGFLAIFRGIQSIYGYFTITVPKKPTFWTLIIGGLDIIFGILLLANIAFKFMTILFLGYSLATWIMITSILRLAALFSSKKTGTIWLLIALNIFFVIIGFSMFFQPIITALTIPTLLGIYFISFSLGKIFTANGGHGE